MVLKDLKAGTLVGNYGGMLIDNEKKEHECVLEVHTHAHTFTHTPTHTHTHTHMLACARTHMKWCIRLSLIPALPPPFFYLYVCILYLGH